MRNIQFKKGNEKKLREQFPNSIFLDEVFDRFILGVNKNGSIRYHHYDLLYAILDINKDEFEGGDYELEKEEFSDIFTDFYDLIDDQLQCLFIEYETLYENDRSNLIPPVLIIFDPDYTDTE